MAAQVSEQPLTEVRPKVFYNGEERPISFAVGSTVLQCDTQAVAVFNVTTDAQRQGLFRSDGVTELLPLEATITRVHGHEPPPAGTVGIRQEEKLILRPSTVRGG